MSTRKPVSFAASRAFCPFLPIARESWLSGTITSTVRSSSSGVPSASSETVTDDTLAGESARATNTAESGDHSTMSIFSPRSSRLITWMRVPRRPTQAPIGSTSRLVGRHRHLGALAGLAGRRLHEDDPLRDLRDLGLEEPDQEAGMRAREQDLRPLAVFLTSNM